MQSQTPKHRLGPFTYVTISHHPQGALSRADTEQPHPWTDLELPSAMLPGCSDVPPLRPDTTPLSITLTTIHDLGAAFLEAVKHLGVSLPLDLTASRVGPKATV